MPSRQMDDPSDDDIRLIRGGNDHRILPRLDHRGWGISVIRSSGVRRAKLYVDEDVEEFVVDMLRAMKVNVLSARKLEGHRGKSDGFHAAFAFKKKRFLVAKNTRDFLRDRRIEQDGYRMMDERMEQWQSD
jgi:Domain of unknown function (DUF5615)